MSDEQIAQIATAVKEAGDLDLDNKKEFSREITALRESIQKALGKKAMAIGKKQLSMIVDNCFKYHGATETAAMLDNIKALGYKYSTIGAITASVFDMHIPGDKKLIVHQAEEQVVRIEKLHARGVLSDEGRYKEIIKIWKDAADKVESELKKGLDDFNPIWMMANSGARGSMGQIRQLAGMRGLMADPSGRTIELPVRSSFREGLSVLEYFISSHGGRKGLADTALKTADSGYLTRRLVDVSHSVVVREQDCGDTKGTFITAIRDEKSVIEALADRIAGRYTIGNVVDPATGEIICEGDTLISSDKAKEIDKKLTSYWESNGSDMHHQPGVLIRSILTCKSKNGVCVKCYGKNMASGNPVKIGEAVGIIAAQSIGEPGTQLTMRTFHSGGVATDDDITQGLPRVVELVEARKPKGEAKVSDIKGKVAVKEEGNLRTVTVRNDEVSMDYSIPFGAKLLVTDGQDIMAGDPLFAGSVNPHDILRTKGVSGVQDMIIKEIQIAYRSNGVQINDKHIEVIVRKMLRKVRVNNPNDTDLILNELVDISTLEEANERALENGGMPATASRVLLGISKAALATDSFLSAASFQETARVLTDAAIKSKADHLVGLKENVIIGKLIPAGTGLKRYANVKLENPLEATTKLREDKFEEVDYSEDDEEPNEK